MIRDLLAGRKPLFLRREIYIVWAMLAGLVIGLGLITGSTEIAILFIWIVVLRMLSVYLNWRLPHRMIAGK